MDKKTEILVKMPDKLGDTVMACSFLRLLKKHVPESTVDVIMAKGVGELQIFMPEIDHVYTFSRKDQAGVIHKYRFGRSIARRKSYDLYFSLQFSFSSALIGFFTRSRKRIGYRTEHRGFLLTDTFALPPGMHVVEDYVKLLSLYLGVDIEVETPRLNWPDALSFELPSRDYLIFNIPSGPPSRYIPVSKSVEVIQALGREYDFDIVLTGAPKERAYIDQVTGRLPSVLPVINLAGRTSVVELGWVLKNARAMITTDSGNAHYANALGTRTVVLFGSGLQSRCQPYDRHLTRSLQVLDLDCVPCRSENCKYGDNRCLANIENAAILAALDDLLTAD